MNSRARGRERLATRLVRGLPQAVIAVAGCVTFLMVAGCSTVVSRIDQNPDLFQSLDRQTQATLLNGEAEIGYTMDMAYIAHGAPDEVWHQQTENGNSVTWLYQYPDLLNEHETFAYGYPLFNHRLGGHHHLLHHPYDRAHVVRDYRRIEFVDGRITSIEEIE